MLLSENTSCSGQRFAHQRFGFFDEWQSYVEGLDDSINFDEDEMCDAYPSLAERQDRNSYIDESLNVLAKS